MSVIDEGRPKLICLQIVILIMLAAAGLFAWRDASRKAAPTAPTPSTNEVKSGLSTDDPLHREYGQLLLATASRMDQNGMRFDAAMLAAKAIGFDGCGAATQDDAFRARFPALLDPKSEPYQHALELVRTNARQARPVWARNLNSPAWQSQPDEKMCISASGCVLAADAFTHIQVWDLFDDKNSLRVRRGQIFNDLALSADGGRLFVASDAKIRIIDLWNPDSTIEELEINSGPVERLTVSVDGSILAAACSDKSIRLWALESQQLINTFETYGEGAETMTFREDNAFLAVSNKKGAVLLFDLRTDSKTPATEPFGGLDVVDSLCFDRSGRYLRILGNKFSEIEDGLRYSETVWTSVNIESGKMQFSETIKQPENDRIMFGDGEDLVKCQDDNRRLSANFRIEFCDVRLNAAFNQVIPIPGWRRLLVRNSERIELWRLDSEWPVIVHQCKEAIGNRAGTLAAAVNGQFVDIVQIGDGSGEIVSSLRLPVARSGDKALSNDGGTLMIAWDTEIIRVKTNTGETLRRDLGALAEGLSFSEDDAKLTANVKGEWRAFDAMTLTDAGPAESPKEPALSSDSPEGTLLSSLDEKRFSFIFQNGRMLRKRHNTGLPDLASLVSDGTVEIDVADLNWPGKMQPGESSSLPEVFTELAHSGYWNEAFALSTHPAMRDRHSASVKLLRQRVERSLETGSISESIAHSRIARLDQLTESASK